MSGALAPVLPFTRTCIACKEALHDRCWPYLAAEIEFLAVPCKCGCRDEFGDLTYDALLDMARRQPEALARMIRFNTTFERDSSLRFHCNLR
jgi:hypothetical protein